MFVRIRMWWQRRPVAYTLHLVPGRASTTDVTRVFIALSNLHRAAGGSTLRYFSWEHDGVSEITAIARVRADRRFHDALVKVADAGLLDLIEERL